MRASYQAILSALVEAQKQRAARRGWHAHEMEVVLQKVNDLRARSGLAEVHLDALQRVESMACGHVDYTTKFALYASELAEGLEGLP